jgi:hypothetical protein
MNTEKFWEQVDASKYAPADCWIWNGRVNPGNRGGYGWFGEWDNGRSAHVFSWELIYGAKPSGTHLHHICKVRNCVNPSHLQLISPEEHPDHVCYKKKKQTYCCRGHLLSSDNLYVYGSKRECKTVDS